MGHILARTRTSRTSLTHETWGTSGAVRSGSGVHSVSSQRETPALPSQTGVVTDVQTLPRSQQRFCVP